MLLLSFLTQELLGVHLSSWTSRSQKGTPSLTLLLPEKFCCPSRGDHGTKSPARVPATLAHRCWLLTLDIRWFLMYLPNRSLQKQSGHVNSKLSTVLVCSGGALDFPFKHNAGELGDGMDRRQLHLWPLRVLVRLPEKLLWRSAGFWLWVEHAQSGNRAQSHVERRRPLDRRPWTSGPLWWDILYSIQIWPTPNPVHKEFILLSTPESWVYINSMSVADFHCMPLVKGQVHLKTQSPTISFYFIE